MVATGPLAGTRWQTRIAPYQRGIMDAFHEQGVQIVIVQGSSQWGKTAVAVNVVAYHIKHDPCSILVVEPTVDPMAKDFARNRLEPVIAASPALRDVVSKKRQKDSSNTTLQKVFRGGSLAIGGANSAASLAARSTRLLILDEVTRYPPELPGEGSTLAIAIKRTTAYKDRRRIMMLSSPGLRGGPIDTWHARGDQRRYHVPCIQCGVMQPYTWAMIRWTDEDPRTARIHCTACDHGMTDAERIAVLGAGEWIPEQTEREDKTVVSFHLWEAYALSVTTPIPTPGGWTTMGDVAAGDMVFGDDGRPCRVLQATPVLDGRPCYLVTFSDGNEIVADANHLWEVERRADEKGKRIVELLSTDAIASSAHYGCGARRYAVRVTEPLDLPDATLPVSPYFLGAWLGDGDSRGARIFSGGRDVESMAAILRSEGFTVLVRRYRGPDGLAILQIEPDNRAESGGVLAALRSLNVIHDGEVSRKHIPPLYLRASRAQRLALLQGLMDTDGCISPDTTACSYSTTSTAIAEGITDLLAGLGIKHACYTRQRGQNKTEMRINFTAVPTVPVFRLPRKLKRQDRQSYRHSSVHRRMIVSVEPIPSVPVRCIAVDNKSHLYLAGPAMIPTHNSPFSSLAEIVAGFLRARAKQKEGDRAEMHTWQNTTLGEPLEPDEGDGVEPMGLLMRREAYGARIDLPAGVCAVTMGVDTQDDRLEVLVWGWGPGEEAWLVDRHTLPGDTEQPEPWQMLDEILDHQYAHANGLKLTIQGTCIDSAGHRTTMVYDYALRNAAKRVFAIIGREGQHPVVSSPSPRRWGRQQRKVPLYTVGVDAAKALWMSRFMLTEKGRGYVHLPLTEWADAELADQLTSERLVTKWHLGVPKQQWRKIRTRNEGLDCAVYALAALKLLHPDLDGMATRLDARTRPRTTPAPMPIAPKVGWLGAPRAGWLKRPR